MAGAHSYRRVNEWLSGKHAAWDFVISNVNSMTSIIATGYNREVKAIHPNPIVARGIVHKKIMGVERYLSLPR